MSFFILFDEFSLFTVWLSESSSSTEYSKEDDIDYSVGFKFIKKKGELVNEGDVILKVLYNDKEKFNEAFDYIEDAITIENISLDEVALLNAKSHILDIVE